MTFAVRGSRRRCWVRLASGRPIRHPTACLSGAPIARVGAQRCQQTGLDLNRTGGILGQERFASFSDTSSFVQPWVGLRAAVRPWPRWPFEVGALAQGFGTGGGVWGWGASATATWAMTRWLNLTAGFRALSSGRNFDSARMVRSVNLTAYGPVLGVGFTF